MTETATQCRGGEDRISVATLRVRIPLGGGGGLGSGGGGLRTEARRAVGPAGEGRGMPEGLRASRGVAMEEEGTGGGLLHHLCPSESEE